MNRTIAVAQQKGGVGKTTVTLNLAAAAANRGLSVLVVDMDPQANASQTLLPDYAERLAADAADATNHPFYTVHDLMEPGVGPGDADEAITATAWQGVDLIPSKQQLAKRDAEGSTGIETRLRIALRGLQRHYDVVLLDCPPSLGRLTVNSLLACQEVLMVAQPDSYSAQAIAQIDKTLAEIRVAFDHDPKVLGLVLNNFEATVTATTAQQKFTSQFGGLLAVIPKRTALQAAAAVNESVFTVNRPDTGGLIATFETLVATLELRPAPHAVGA